DAGGRLLGVVFVVLEGYQVLLRLPAVCINQGGRVPDEGFLVGPEGAQGSRVASLLNGRDDGLPKPVQAEIVEHEVVQRPAWGEERAVQLAQGLQIAGGLGGVKVAGRGYRGGEPARLPYRALVRLDLGLDDEAQVVELALFGQLVARLG